MEGNSKLQASGSVAELAGFGVAGVLVQALTAPLVLLIDAGSFLASATAVAAIGAVGSTRDEDRVRGEDGPTAWGEIADGVRFVGGHTVLRAVAAAGGTVSLFRGMIGVVIILYLVRGLHLTPALLGPLFALGGISAVLGAAAASRVLRRWGLGRTMVSSLLLASAAGLCLPLAGGSVWLIVGLLAAQQVCGDGAATVYEIAAVSLRQAVTPDRLQGRVHATFQFIAGAAQLTGFLAGGALGPTIGLRLTLGLGVGGTALGALWLLVSPVRSLRAYPLDAK